jgi:hypothetical protein
MMMKQRNHIFDMWQFRLRMLWEISRRERKRESEKRARYSVSDIRHKFNDCSNSSELREN